MFITFKQLEGTKLLVEYSEIRPNPAVEHFRNKCHFIGTALVSFANDKEAIASIMPNDLLDCTGVDVDSLQEELQDNLRTISGRGFIIPEPNENIVDRLRHSTLLLDSPDLSTLSAPRSFRVCYDFSRAHDLYAVWQVFEVMTLSDVIALEYIKYAEALIDRKVKPINECAQCGKFYISEKYSKTSFCSESCRKKNFSKTTKSDAYYRKYYNMRTSIKRYIDPTDFEVDCLYQKWKSFAMREWKKGSTAYSSPTEYGKAMRKYWNDLGGQKHGKYTSKTR